MGKDILACHQREEEGRLGQPTHQLPDFSHSNSVPRTDSISVGKPQVISAPALARQGCNHRSCAAVALPTVISPSSQRMAQVKQGLFGTAAEQLIHGPFGTKHCHPGHGSLPPLSSAIPPEPSP